MSGKEANEIVMIPVEKIRVLNPRSRNKKKFQKIVANISRLGLKRPINVIPGGNGYFDLECGQGRLEAAIQLGWTEIPAIVKGGTKEDCLLRSLVENIGRRRLSALDQIEDIRKMRERGHSHEEIAKSTDLSSTYICEVLRLVQKGEERLVLAVDRGDISMSTAKLIAETDDKELQAALREAYEKKLIPGHELRRARKLADQRDSLGKGMISFKRKRERKWTSMRAVVRAYEEDVRRHKAMIREAKLCEARLLFLVSAFGILFAEETFVTLLRAEKLDDAPKVLMDRIRSEAEGKG